MLRIEPLRPHDIPALAGRLQPAQQDIRAYLTLEYGGQLLDAGPSQVVWGPHGQPIFAGGLMRQWEGRGLVWALVAADAGRWLVQITRATWGFLDAQPEERLETAVQTGWKPGARWAALLGFEREGTMRRWMDGQDFDLWARVRHG